MHFCLHFTLTLTLIGLACPAAPGLSPQPLLSPSGPAWRLKLASPSKIVLASRRREEAAGSCESEYGRLVNERVMIGNKGGTGGLGVKRLNEPASALPGTVQISPRPVLHLLGLG